MQGITVQVSSHFLPFVIVFSSFSPKVYSCLEQCMTVIPKSRMCVQIMSCVPLTGTSVTHRTLLLALWPSKHSDWSLPKATSCGLFCFVSECCQFGRTESGKRHEKDLSGNSLSQPCSLFSSGSYRWLSFGRHERAFWASVMFPTSLFSMRCR